MRKISNILISCLMLLSFCFISGQVMAAQKGEKEEKTTEKKTPYEEFMTADGLEKEEGFVNIFRKEGKVWLEIPESMIGRRIISSTRIESSSNSSIAVGSELSSTQVLVIDKTDSLLLLRKPARNVVIKDHDDAIARALSGREPIIYSFPIKYRGDNDASYVIQADALFDISNKSILNLKGSSFDDSMVAESTLKSGSKLFREMVSFGNSVGIRNDATYELGIAVPGFGFISSDRPIVTLTVLTTISILPEKQIQGRLADTRVGTRHEGFTIFKAQEEIKNDSWAQRWDIQPADSSAYFAGKGSEVAEPITIYVDTLLGPAWMNAVREGILAWEPAFDAIGLHQAIQVKPYPSDGAFLSSSPLYSTVSFVGGHGTEMSATILSDATSGQIFSCRLMIPGDYIAGVHKRSVFNISDVDPRYRSFNLPEDAVCEVLKADVMKLFGLCLGFTSNMAGSAAYSPEQLRDPQFTAEHGITASVTDDVLFNYLTVPGDKERGVATIVNQIGAYDKFAVEWLYRPFEKNEKEELEQLISSKAGNPEYFYAGRQRTLFDSRALNNDLGNDIFESYESGLKHLKFVADHAHEWLDPDKMDDTYLVLFYDWLWMRFNSLTYILSSHVGAINTNDPRSGLPRMEGLPVEIQRRALKTSLENYMDISWLESNKKLLHASGAYKDATRLTLTSILQISGMSRRLPMVAMAEQELGNAYSPDAFMTDLREILLKTANQGRLDGNGYDIAVAKYIVWLISNSDIMKQNYRDFMDKTGRRNAFAVSLEEGERLLDEAQAQQDALRLQIGNVPEKYTVELETICYNHLVEARKMIYHGFKACKNDYDKQRFEFLLSIADAGLGQK